MPVDGRIAVHARPYSPLKDRTCETNLNLQTQQPREAESNASRQVAREPRCGRRHAPTGASEAGDVFKTMVKKAQ